MRTKNVLWIVLTALMVASTLSQTKIVAASPTTWIAVEPRKRDTRNLVALGGTFSINVTVANVQKLMGYQFMLNYNTTILTATDAVSYSPFVKVWQSQINDTAGSVAMAYSYQLGEKNGLTTIDPVRIARIDFLVEENGTTDLSFDADPAATVMTNVYGDAIAFDNPSLTLGNIDGKFSNTEVIGTHDISITSLTVSPTTLKPGELISINVSITNKGEFNETFTVKAEYNATQIQTPRTVTNLAPQGSTTVSFTWNTANVAAGTYVVSVSANVDEENAPEDNTRTETVKIESSTTGFQFNPLYIAAAIIVIIAVVVAVYALRARKPK